MEKNNLVVAQAYYQAINAGKFNDDYFSLFADDVEIYYPKFGFGTGIEGIRKFGEQLRHLIDSLHFKLEKFNYIVADQYVVVEGFEEGVTSKSVKFPDHVITHGKFCSVFEFENHQIKRMHCYVDPDFAAEDTERIRLLNSTAAYARQEQIEVQTKAVVEDFYDIQSGRKKGNITDLFAEDVDWDLPGNPEKFSWTGKRRTKAEIQQFFQELHSNIKSERFAIEFISVKGENATAVGNLSSKILKYDKVFHTDFVVIFKVVDGKIVKYHFLEDSYKLNEQMK